MPGDYLPLPIRIGISGISTSGKSTVVEAIKSQLACEVVPGDNFYIRDGTCPKVKVGELTVTNWDDPRSIDWNKFHSRIIESKSDLVLVDSFQLFYNPSIAESIDAAIILEYTEADFPVALERRVLRHAHQHTPANYRVDISTNKANYECTYFEDVVWKLAFDKVEYWDHPDFTKPVLRLKATNPLDVNIRAALAFVSQIASAGCNKSI